MDTAGIAHIKHLIEFLSLIHISCVDENCLANGTFLKIENTPFDFKEFHEIGERINDDHEQLKLAGGYEMCIRDREESIFRSVPSSVLFV